MLKRQRGSKWATMYYTSETSNRHGRSLQFLWSVNKIIKWFHFKVIYTCVKKSLSSTFPVAACLPKLQHSITMCHDQQVCKTYDEWHLPYRLTVFIFSSQESRAKTWNDFLLKWHKSKSVIKLFEIKIKKNISPLKVIENQSQKITPNWFKITISNQMILNHSQQCSRKTWLMSLPSECNCMMDSSTSYCVYNGIIRKRGHFLFWVVR